MVNEKDVNRIVTKTQQVIGIFGTLWDRRINALTEYVKKKYGFRFLLFKGKPKTETVLKEAFAKLIKELSNVNAKEKCVIELIQDGVESSISTIEKAMQEAQSLREQLTKQMQQQVKGPEQFEEALACTLAILRRYKDLMKTQKDILDLEQDFIKKPAEDKWQLYLRRIEYFSFEMKQVIAEYKKVSGTKATLAAMSNAIERLRTLSGRKQPQDYVAPSTISAFFRVGVSNIVSGAVLGNPFTNPYFWKLSSLIFITVIIVNFVDYYFNIFTNLTAKINKLMRLAK